ncbi:glycosyltransferase family 9 protein [Patescibacteria group bacterium]
MPKILVGKRDALGDIISITPFLEVLRRSFPKAHITYVVGSWSQAVLKNNPNIDELIVVDSGKWQGRLSRFKERSKLVKKLKKYGFDKVFILQGPAPFHFWEKFSEQIGAKERIGFRNHGAKTTFTDSVELPEHDGHLFKTLDKNRAEHYLDLLREVGIKDTTNQGNRLYWQPNDEEFAEIFFTKNGLTGSKVVTIAPGGAQNPGMKQLVKRWPLERYIKVAEHLIRETGAKILLIGGPSDHEVNQKLLKGISRDMQKSAVDSAGEANIHQSATLIEKSDLFIGNDSGPLHIASTTKTLIIAIFGPTNPVVDGPYKLNGKLLFHETDDSPCYTMNCEGHTPCIENVSIKEVIGEATKLLNQS